jgi:hypothetical protein
MSEQRTTVKTDWLEKFQFAEEDGDFQELEILLAEWLLELVIESQDQEILMFTDETIRWDIKEAYETIETLYTIPPEISHEKLTHRALAYALGYMGCPKEEILQSLSSELEHE